MGPSADSKSLSPNPYGGGRPLSFLQYSGQLAICSRKNDYLHTHLRMAGGTVLFDFIGFAILFIILLILSPLIMSDLSLSEKCKFAAFMTAVILSGIQSLASHTRISIEFSKYLPDYDLLEPRFWRTSWWDKSLPSL